MTNSIGQVVRLIDESFKANKSFVIGIDGESHSGKTVLGRYLVDKFSDAKLVSLDEYLSDSSVRKAAYRNPDKRGDIFKYWFDEEKLAQLVRSLEGHIIIEGTFLLSALPRETFNLVICVKSSIDIKEKRVSTLRKNNKGFSQEEADTFDRVYRDSWSNYVKIFPRKDSDIEVDPTLF